MEEKRFETNFGGQSLVIETGLAPQANAAIKLTYGETVVLVTAVLSGNAREGVNYLPLMVADWVPIYLPEAYPYGQ